MILPVTGRGAIRRMVEGAVAIASLLPHAPLHPAATRRGPPPQFGED